MILLVGHYDDSNPERAAEFRQALARNADQAPLDRIQVLVEDDTPIEALRARGHPYDDARVQLVPHRRRLSFEALFAIANRDWAGHQVIVANADICFDDTLALVEDAPLAGTMLCLSRWDLLPDGRLQHYDAPFSQDAWIFEPPLPPLACAFELGTPGCDNRLAHEAAQAGLELRNPSRSVRAIHLHASQVRRYGEQQRLPGPYRFVPASFLGGGDGGARWGCPTHAAHRRRCEDLRVRAAARPLEAGLQAQLGSPLPRALRLALRDAVARRLAPLPTPSHLPLARLGFRETMGYQLQQMQPGVSTHANDARPMTAIPPALQGLWFTQVVANHAAPVAVEFITPGRAHVLSGRGWHGHDVAAAWLDEAGWRNAGDSVHTSNGTVFDVWTVAGEAGEQFSVPTQVMLAAADLRRLT